MASLEGNDVVTTALRAVEDELVDGVAEGVLSSVQLDRDQVNSTYNQVLTLALRSTPLQQFGVSFGAGWLSGYLFRKVSRLAAILVGTSFLAVQGASMLGLIKVNWRRLGLVMKEKLQRVPSIHGDRNSTLLASISRFSQQHIYITSGFSTGAVLAFIY